MLATRLAARAVTCARGLTARNASQLSLREADPVMYNLIREEYMRQKVCYFALLFSPNSRVFFSPCYSPDLHGSSRFRHKAKESELA